MAQYIQNYSNYTKLHQLHQLQQLHHLHKWAKNVSIFVTVIMNPLYLHSFVVIQTT